MTDPVDFDEYAKNYNQLLQEDTAFFSSNDEYFAKYKVKLMFEQVASPVGRVLEYGCGIGRNIPYLQQAFPGAEIVGSDISESSLEVARKNNAGIKFVQEGLHAEPLGQFDVIFVAGVFHHVPLNHRLVVGKKLFDYLLPHSLLFVFEHNPFNPVTRHIVSHCPYDEDAVLLRPKELREILKQSGLFIERKAFCLFFPPRFSVLSRLEEKLGWCPFGGQYWMQARRLD